MVSIMLSGQTAYMQPTGQPALTSSQLFLSSVLADHREGSRVVCNVCAFGGAVMVCASRSGECLVRLGFRWSTSCLQVLASGGLLQLCRYYLTTGQQDILLEL